MTLSRARVRSVSWLVWLAAIPSLAWGADPDCSTLPNPIFIAGSSSVQPMIQLMGAGLSGVGTTLVYQRIGSCAGVSAVLNDATPSGPCLKGACITGTATFYDEASRERPCTLDPAGAHVDVGVSDVYVSTCTGTEPPLSVGDFLGPVSALTFVVPNASQQKIITAEEAYFAFGFGAKGMALPWIEETRLFFPGRPHVVGRVIGVPADRMKGVDALTSDAVVTNLQASSPEQSLGILSAEVANQNDMVLRTLAFRGFAQRYGYYPDSSRTSGDKRNVRDGHYLPWGYMHLIAAVDGDGAPERAGAKKFVSWMFGRDQAAPFDIVDVQIKARTVPQCAMTVKRTDEGGDLALHNPVAPCGCYFEKMVGTTTCAACTDDRACNGGKCRRGFCEVR